MDLELEGLDSGSEHSRKYTTAITDQVYPNTTQKSHGGETVRVLMLLLISPVARLDRRKLSRGRWLIA
ncbi:hypothetical protein E2C01_024998 [Portunus trituberculatus]|uniref:Uncharacterized protein n=1 Tax=Portunus trituberculatus TaxID=210409 RepID=A0A5B7EC25_PORTR|nr:hypothetical protein [Portunus trituberculatus]